LDAFVSGLDMRLSVRRNATAFADFGKTGNQRAVARAIESQGLGADPYDQVLVLENGADAPGIYDQLSGEIYASTQSALLDTSGLLRQAVLARARQGRQGMQGSSSASGLTVRATAGSHAVWGQALGSWGRLGASDDAQELERSVGGMIFGADKALGEHARMGVAGGFTSSTFRGAGSSQAKADGYHLALYAGTKRGQWALRGGLNQSWYDVRTRRQIGYADLGSPRSEHRAQSMQLFGEAGYEMSSGAMTFEPYAGLAHVRLRSQSADERDSAAGLHVDRSSQAVTYSTLGVRA
jgi:subtilase-type serine protease